MLLCAYIIKVSMLLDIGKKSSPITSTGSFVYVVIRKTLASPLSLTELCCGYMCACMMCWWYLEIKKNTRPAKNFVIIVQTVVEIHSTEMAESKLSSSSSYWVVCHFSYNRNGHIHSSTEYIQLYISFVIGELLLLSKIDMLFQQQQQQRQGKHFHRISYNNIGKEESVYRFGKKQTNDPKN